jgi:cell division protein FtsL
MKKILIILIILTIPVLFSLEVWQVSRYNELSGEVDQLEEEQRDWIDKNKKILADISVLRSPERIQKLATEQLNLEPLEPDKILRIKFH